MYDRGEYESVPATEYFQAIIDGLKLTFGPDTELTFSSNSSWRIAQDQVTPAGLLLNELITNAHRHGLRGRPGSIAIELYTRDGGTHLRVRDSGGGFPKALAGSDGRGLSLAKGLCRQLGGRLALSNDGGAICDVDIPLQ
jgi:two-component sensor histidine kinase